MKSLAYSLALLPALASAATMGVHIASWHPSRPDLNPVNPGVYWRSDGGWTAGAYYNSIRRLSTYGGRTFTRGPFSLTVGAITGYDRPLYPLLVPSVLLGKHWRIVFIPAASKATETFHVAYEWKLR